MHTQIRRLVGLLATLLAATLLTPHAALAHEGHGEEDAAAHAAEDLAGVSIDTIEKKTAANAREVAADTGTRPGRRTPAAAATRLERAAAAAAVDPGQGGAWGSVVPTPVVPIFQAVLPDGKVLMWDSVGDGPAESYDDQSFTRAMVWNPADDTSKRVDVAGYNIFCAGYVQLPDGNVLVVGGNKNRSLDGIRQTHIFNWQTQTWSRGPDMAGERWYPSVAALANGEAVIVGGGPSTAEVRQLDGLLRPLTGFASVADRVYPFLVPRPDTRVEMVGPNTGMTTMTTTGTGSIGAARMRDGIYRSYGSFATYATGKTLVAGGGDVTEGGQQRVPTRTAVVVDTNGTGTSTATTGSMAVGRRQHNLTILADGSVLATGGETKAVDGLVDLDNAAFAAERWDPATGAWTTLAGAARIRQYHSTAALLPDGRVLTGGGGICGTCQAKGYLEKNVEYFTPPYLYKKDGSGQLASRPQVTAAPTTVGFGQSFALTSPQAASIRKVGLVRFGAPTHGDDQGQRYVPLTFTASGSTVTVSSPANGGLASPGYYMLFVTDAAGVPSVARTVKVQAAAVPPTTPTAAVLKGADGRSAEVRNASTGSGTPLQMATCTGSARQLWTPNAADGSLRSLDRCLAVSYNWFRAGNRAEISSCRGTTAQKWQRRSDGTVRPTSASTLCLVPAESSRVRIQTCNGSAAQRWT